MKCMCSRLCALLFCCVAEALWEAYIDLKIAQVSGLFICVCLRV
jgi:hypothetical protein